MDTHQFPVEQIQSGKSQFMASRWIKLAALNFCPLQPEEREGKNPVRALKRHILSTPQNHKTALMATT
ncbi:hypothetical protein Baya_16237 [Bagarius yarrelli]|uniref:Uncharacterized protein n=1 Tax=Bagarius yarrelli TaxID=175774 RepID=A0A556VV39_BAGYA|nr:hypothetical protein Baya_16237 [Bagarius yarrelli]